MKQALGLVEVSGLTTAIVVADTMSKSANVELLEIENSKGGGYMTIKIVGDVGAVNAAVAAGKQLAIECNKLVSFKVIPRPSERVGSMFCKKQKEKQEEKQEVKIKETKKEEKQVEEVKSVKEEQQVLEVEEKHELAIEKEEKLIEVIEDVKESKEEIKADEKVVSQDQAPEKKPTRQRSRRTTKKETETAQKETTENKNDEK